MNFIPIQYTILLKRLLILFAVYAIMRLLFYIFNSSYFTLTTSQTIFAFVAGLRFDLVAITITNLFFIVLHLLPLRMFYSFWYQYLLSFLFIVLNGLAIIFNCVDFAFFKFQLKRSGADLIKVLMLGDDTGNNLGAMVLDFWHIPLIAIILISIMVMLYKKTRASEPEFQNRNKIIGWLLIVPAGLLVLLAFRGGAQYKPLRIISASEYSSPQNAPLILNTTFTIIKTYNKDALEIKTYFSDTDVEKVFTPVHQFKRANPFRNLNVVVIILESIGKEYFGAYNNYKGYTPFLDSLITESLSFDYSYANSKRSIEGIPAVTASIPQLMSEAFITSVYDGNKFNSLASLLKQKGYRSAFFHGGNNGTMGFDQFTAAAGYDKYFGRKEYGQSDYDGNWGIYDEAFYKFYVDKMNEMPQPFHTTFFSISSHHPYSIPPKYKNKFPKGTLPIHESVGYADYSLQTFFEKASHQTWYDSTLFVITTDHTSEAENEYYKNRLGIYAVPVIYYMPNSSLKARSVAVTQQASILPSVLDYLNYDLPFIAFGNSVFDSSQTQFAVNFMNGSYQLIADDYALQFDGEKVTSIYTYKTDSLLKHNLIDYQPKVKKYEDLLKATVQQYNNRLIRNKLSITP